MSPDAISRSELIDIIFENRNKQYGAYELRSSYTKRLKTGLAVMLLCPVLLWSFIQYPSGNKKNYTPVFLADTLYDIKLPEAKPIEPLPTRTSPNTAAAVKYTSNIKVVPNPEADHVPDLKEIQDKAIADFTREGTPEAGIVQPPPTAVVGNETQNTVNTAPQEEGPWTSVEIMPQFPGGPNALRRFLERQLRPINGQEAGTQKKVQIRFVIDISGHLGQFSFIESPGQEYEEEVIRVLRKMPAWSPGIQNGNKVPVYFIMPFIFQTETE